MITLLPVAASTHLEHDGRRCRDVGRTTHLSRHHLSAAHAPLQRQLAYEEDDLPQEPRHRPHSDWPRPHRTSAPRPTGTPQRHPHPNPPAARRSARPGQHPGRADSPMVGHRRWGALDPGGVKRRHGASAHCGIKREDSMTAVTTVVSRTRPARCKVPRQAMPVNITRRVNRRPASEKSGRSSTDSEMELRGDGPGGPGGP